MKTSWLFYIAALLFTGLLSYIHLNTDLFYGIATLVVMTTLATRYRNQVNIVHIITVIFLFTIIEFGLFELIDIYMREEPPYKKNFMVYLMHFFVDVSILLILRKRVMYSLLFMRRFHPNNWRAIYITHADILLYGIYILFIIVDSAAFVENLFRNMDYIFGVSEATAKPFWSWNWVYKSYPYAKSILLSCVVTILLATIFVENQRPEQEDDDEDDNDEVIHKTDQQQKP
ncbi:hypothetical protein [Pseudoalteromonas piscicida]|uniref:Uncharacterized protein n=1 Tax=Pseudoalteromonas piscicida TaxID=43662 RepID=A0AAD0RLW0_PSEO7|nr:hypothetical protein [Pseudoalteromonas piscicida]ASD69733.1 hypothetical protein B1L02_23105 [Pseudoalteromonas piscicida]AXR04771.1 hypothetical protein D0511_23215 [Pseudoalteromonas piscicida]